LIFDLFTLKVVFESRMMWATSVPILFFLSRERRGLGLSVLDLVKNTLARPRWLT